MTELMEFAEQNIHLVELFQDKLSMWIFGYIYTQAGSTRAEIAESIETSKSSSSDASIDRLRNAG